METKSKCLKCDRYKGCRDSYASWFFFVLGLISTVAVRIVTVLIHLDPVYGKIAWYTGVGGFFIFFLYKFRINQERARLVSGQKIMEKVNKGEGLTEDDFSLLRAILCGLTSRKERINYFFIFGLSALALAVAVYLDFSG